jgi:hypothetical protein
MCLRSYVSLFVNGLMSIHEEFMRCVPPGGRQSLQQTRTIVMRDFHLCLSAV